MKTLYLLRHAQKAKIYDDDFTRTLSQKGIQDAEILAQKLAKQEIFLDAILASPAKRTKQTAEIFAKYLKFNKAIFYNQNIYLGYVNDLKEVISYTHDDINTLLVVGHNPSLSALCVTLSDEFKINMQMCSIAKFEFKCTSWLDICKQNAKFMEYKHL